MKILVLRFQTRQGNFVIAAAVRDKSSLCARETALHAVRFVLGIIKKMQLKSDWKHCKFAHANFITNGGGNATLIERDEALKD